MLSQEETTQIQAIQSGRMDPARVTAAAAALVSAKQARDAAARIRDSAINARAAVSQLRRQGSLIPVAMIRDSKKTERLAASAESAAASAVRSANAAVAVLTADERVSVENELKYMTEQDTGVRELKAPPAMAGLGVLPRGLTASRDLRRPISGNHFFFGSAASSGATAEAQERARARAVNENILRQRFNMSGWIDDRAVTIDEFH